MHVLWLRVIGNMSRHHLNSLLCLCDQYYTTVAKPLDMTLKEDSGTHLQILPWNGRKCKLFTKLSEWWMNFDKYIFMKYGKYLSRIFSLSKEILSTTSSKPLGNKTFSPTACATSTIAGNTITNQRGRWSHFSFRSVVEFAWINASPTIRKILETNKCLTI